MLQPVVRIRPDDEWLDVSDWVRYESGLDLERGREAEYDATSSLLTFVLDNRDNRWSSDVPGTPYYRQLGRTTPVDMRQPILLDEFGGSATNSWGSTEDPAVVWQQTGTASDYQRTAGVGRHILTDTGTARSSWLELSMRDLIVRGSVQVQAVATGAQFRYGVVARRKPGDAAHYRAELRFDTSGAVQAAICRAGSPFDTDIGEFAVDGTYTAGSIIHYEFIVDGNQLLFKAWFDGQGEPRSWQKGYDDYYTFGHVGVRSVRDTSNSNTNLQLDTLRFEVSQPRFAGEVSSMTPMQDKSGRDATMTVEASGILRRLSNTAKPIRSALFRSIRRGAVGFFERTPVGYWPLEDGSLASQLEVLSESGLAKPGYFSGDVNMAADQSVPGSAALPSVSAGGMIAGSFPAFPDGFDASTDNWAINFLVKIDEVPDVETVIARFGTSTEAAMYEVAMDTSGNLIFRAPKLYQLLADTFVFEDSQPYDAARQYDKPSLFGRWVRIHIGNVAFGGASNSVDMEWYDALIDSDGAVLAAPSGTTVWREPNGAWQLFGPPEGSRGFGHVSAHAAGVRYTADGMVGWAGETAGDRIDRLADEEDFDADTRGTGVPLGPQPQGTLIDAIEDAVQADLGILVEPRIYRGVWFLAHTRLYNQLPAAIVDLTNGELTDGFAPVRDDASGLANYIEASRPDGTPQEYTIADGDVFHLTTEEPPDGISLAPASISPNVEDDLDAAAQASWHAHLRAWREPRYEELRFCLHSPTYRADPQLTADVGGLEIGDMLQLDNQPAWAPPDPVQLLVQGIRELSDTKRRELVLTCTPYVPWEVWCVNTSGSTVSTAATDSATTLWVATSSGPEWQTSPDPPFLVQVAGEGIRVTGVATQTPSYVGVGAAAHGDNATLNPALPGSLQVGDLMILVAAIRNTGAAVGTTPTGWTSISSAYNAFRIYARYYVSGDTAPSVTFTGGAAGDTTSAFVCAFRNLSMEDSDARFGATNGSPENQANSSAQNIAYPAMSVRRDGGVVLYVGWKQDDMTSSTGPGDAEIIEATTTTGNDQTLVAYYDIQTTATDVTAGSITVTGGASAISRTLLLALRPLQTFTVERSLNGVSQAVAAGAAVNVWRHGAVPL